MISLDLSLERRRQYRVSVGPGLRLEAKVCGKGNIEIGVELVDLTYAGVGILVPRSIQRTLGVGQQIALKFTSESIDWSITASGRIQNIIEFDPMFRVGIEFNDLNAVDQQLTPALRTLFNRRRAFRTMTDIIGATECQWSPIDQAHADTTYRGNLIDISGTGLAMSTGLEYERLLIQEETYRTHVMVNQEGLVLDFTLIGRLLHLEKYPKELRVGFEFEEDDSSFFKDQQTELFHFVAEVQRRTLKENADTEMF